MKSDQEILKEYIGNPRYAKKRGEAEVVELHERATTALEALAESLETMTARPTINGALARRLEKTFTILGLEVREDISKYLLMIPDISFPGDG